MRSGRATIVVASAWLSGFTVAGVYLLHAGFRRRVSNTLPFADDDYILIIAWYATILLVGMGCGWLMSVVRERC